MREQQKSLSFITLLMMISFASVNAVLFTPALPDIAIYFGITADVAQYTITWFLIGYAFGQLIYGPVASRFGRKSALYIGISLQIVSSFVCIFAGQLDSYNTLVLGRFLLALGSGVGLKMTFTLLNETYDEKIASQKTSYLALAFAITPGLGIALGGFLNAHFGWQSCFYASSIYGLLLLLMVTRLPETQTERDLDAFKFHHLIASYAVQFKNRKLLTGAFLMGCSTSFVYVFAATAPFVAMHLFGMDSANYGIANMLPPVGLVLGSLCSAKLATKIPLTASIKWGIGITLCGVIFMIAAVLTHQSAMYSLFSAMIIIYFGLSFIIGNAPAFAMSQSQDKAHGSAVMSFVNMGTATILVLSLSAFAITINIIPAIFLFLTIGMMMLACLLPTGK